MPRKDPEARATLPITTNASNNYPPPPPAQSKLRLSSIAFWRALCAALTASSRLLNLLSAVRGFYVPWMSSVKDRLSGRRRGESLLINGYPKTCYMYFPIGPLLARYQDNDDHRPWILVRLPAGNKEYEVALFALNGHICMGRITVPNAEELNIPPKDVAALQELKEYVLSFIRAAWPQQSSMPISYFYNFVPKDMNPHLEHGDTAKLRNGRVVRSATSDSRAGGIQYRYLSFYKLLEFEFKAEKGWKKSQLSKFLAGFDHDLAALKLTNPMLNAKDANEVEHFLPFMQRVAVAAINKTLLWTGLHTVPSQVIDLAAYERQRWLLVFYLVN